MKKLIKLNLTSAVALLVCLFVNSAGADHDVTTPSATIKAAASPVDRGDDVKFKAVLSRDLAHAVLVLVNWTAPGITANPRYWWVNNSGFEFSFPCNLANQGVHTITIQTSNDNTDEATRNSHNSSPGNSSAINSTPYPMAYNVGSTSSSATSTCN